MALNFPDSPTLNQVYTDTTSGFSYQWDGVVWQSYTPSATKNILIIDDVSTSFNGSTQTFALASSGSAVTPLNAQQLRVVLGGIVQEPGTDYTVSGSNITFTIAPTAGLDCSIVSLGPAIPLSSIIDGTVTPAKLSTGGPSWDTNGNVVITGTGTTALLVNGNARVSGILTVGTSSITLNGVDDRITVGTGLTLSSGGIQAGVITATTLNATTITGAVSGNATGLTGTPNITVGVITAASAVFSGNVSVGGTLTYDDVTNVDSVGLITARSGVNVTGGSINVSSGNISVSGLATATEFDISGSTNTLSAGGLNVGFATAGTGCVTGTLTAGTATVPGTLTGGVVCATSCFSGSGSGLTNIPSGAISGGLSAADICTFNSSGTWTKPTTAKFVTVELLGGGGGGAAGATLFCTSGQQLYEGFGGGGGGGGAYTSATFPAQALSPTVPITVGAGGPGGTGCCTVCQGPSWWGGCPGSDGGSSCFGTYLFSSGGRGAPIAFAPPTLTPANSTTLARGGAGGLSGALGFGPCQTAFGGATNYPSGGVSYFGGGGGGDQADGYFYQSSGPPQVTSPTTPSCQIFYGWAQFGAVSLFGGSGGGGGAGGSCVCPAIVTNICCGGCGGGYGNSCQSYMGNFGRVAGGTPTARTGCSAPTTERWGGGGGVNQCPGGNGGLASGGGGGGGVHWTGSTGTGGNGGSGGNGRVIVYTWS